MFEYISGKLTEKNPAYMIVDSHGIGYYINISLHTFSLLKDKNEVKLLIHFVVREDAQILFGFAEESERTIFRHLISVSGVGANTARMMLSSMQPAEIATAIANGEANLLQKIKGIGAKSAQRIIIDLKDKIIKTNIQGEILSVEYNTNKEDALTALTTLGFSKIQAEKALKKVFANIEEDAAVEEIIKNALKILN
jgi:holliday junction DNA helicase RuvA